MRDFSDRLWEKIDRRSPTECWLWTGAVMSDGYGTIGTRKPHIGLAHRFAWMLTRGDIPDGLCVLHTCDVKLCCNPNHLWLGTVADNNGDKEAKGRANHPRGEENGRATVTEADVLAMRALSSVGQSNSDIALRFGVPRHVVWNAVTRRTWAQVP